MPIRQTRMIALINAATDYRSLAWMVQKWFANTHIQHMSQSELLAQIASWNIELDEAIRERAGQHNEVINAEYNHFHRNANRNEREMLEQQIRRGRNITPTRRQPKLHSQETPKLRQAFTENIHLTELGIAAQDRPKAVRRVEATAEENAELAAFIESLKKQEEEEADNQPFKGKQLFADVPNDEEESE